MIQGGGLYSGEGREVQVLEVAKPVWFDVDDLCIFRETGTGTVWAMPAEMFRSRFVLTDPHGREDSE